MLTDALINEILVKFEQQRDSIADALPGAIHVCGVAVKLPALGFLASSLANGGELLLEEIEHASRLSESDGGGRSWAAGDGGGNCFLQWWNDVLARAQAIVADSDVAVRRRSWTPDARSRAAVMALLRIADLWLWLGRQRFWWQRLPYRKVDVFSRLVLSNGLAVSVIEDLLGDLKDKEEVMHCALMPTERYWVGVGDPNTLFVDLSSKDGSNVWTYYQAARSRVKSTDMSWLRSESQAGMLVFLQDRGQAELVRQRLQAEVGQGCHVNLRFASGSDKI